MKMKRATRFLSDFFSAFDNFFDLSPYFDGVTDQLAALLAEREKRNVPASIGMGYMSSVTPIKASDKTREVTLRPQVAAFRIEELVWDVLQTSDWTVHDIRVGNHSQFVHSAEIPLNKVYGPLKFETLQTAMDFSITVSYHGENPEGEVFAAVVKGPMA